MLMQSVIKMQNNVAVDLHFVVDFVPSHYYNHTYFLHCNFTAWRDFCFR